MDARFLELTQYAKMDCVAIDNHSKISYPHYNADCLNKYLSYEEQLKYLGSNQLHKRNQNRENVDRIKICADLEKAILDTGLFPK